MAVDIQQAGAAVFELVRFEWATPERIELVGNWSQVRGRRFMRPTLVLEGEEGQQTRLLATLEHKPWAAEEEETWIAAFECPGGPIKFTSATLNVASGVDLDLPPPRLRPGRPRRDRLRLVSYDAGRAPVASPALLKSPGIVTDPIATAAPERIATADAGAARPTQPGTLSTRAAAAEPAPAAPVVDSPELDRIRAERDRALDEARSLRTLLEAARRDRERAIAAAAGADKRAKAAALLAEQRERHQPVHEPQPRFRPIQGAPSAGLDTWGPRAVATTILVLFALVVLRLFAGL